MNVKTIGIVAVSAAVVVFGFPFFSAYFTNWRAEGWLKEEFRSISSTHPDKLLRISKLMVAEYDLPIDLEDEDEFNLWVDEETNSMGADFYYVKDVNIFVKVVPVELSISVERTWKK